MYQVLARKWRPQTFDEIVGQQHVTQTLANAVEGDRVAHAYIFSGLRGTGKTTAARVLAKCLNCEKGPTPSPCGQCDPCREIAESRAIDVLEVDAASRTKVEQTRELLEVVAYAPARDRHKILIIDEAHMLSKASFNALLKTLEEPPPNVVFILATTEIQKILPTILSRCQVFEFRRIGPSELGEHLARICKEEGFEASRTTLERLARAGEGSVRDALSLLERAVAFGGQRINEDDVLRMLGGVRAQVLVDTLTSLAARDAAGMLSVLDRLVDEGHDLGHFWSELVAALRDLMVMRAVRDQQQLLSRSPDEMSALSSASEGLTSEDLTRTFQILADLEPTLKSSSHPRFMFESALIRLASLGSVRPIEEVLQSLGGSTATGSKATPAQKKSPRVQKPATADPVATNDRPHEELIAAVHRARPVLGAILEQAESIQVSADELVLGFARGAAAVVRRLERQESLELIQREAARVLGRPLRARVEIAASEGQHSPPETGGNKSALRSAPEPDPDAGVSDRATLLERATGEPGVKKLLREFGAQVVDIEPLEPIGDAAPRPLEETK